MKRQILKTMTTAVLAGTVFTACQKETDSNELDLRGAQFVVCEGNFGENEGRIDALVGDSVIADVFDHVNGRPLGDIVQSMAVIGTEAYIVVNNSQKIEVVDVRTFRSKGVATGLSYPRHVAERNRAEIFLTNGNGYGDDYVYVLDKETLARVDSVAVAAGPEDMAVANGRLFVASMGGYTTNNKVTVIDTKTLAVVREIEVGDAPCDLATDAHGDVIVFCKGKTLYDDAWQPIGATNAAIVKIDAGSLAATTLTTFDHATATYGTNVMACDGNTLYYIDDALYSMPVGGTPDKLAEGSFYGIGYAQGAVWTTSTPYDGLHMVTKHKADGSTDRQFTVGYYPNTVKE